LDRKIVLEGLKAVTKVIIFDEDTPLNLIKILSPDIIVKGGDYSADTVVGREFCEVRIFQTIPGYSSSELIRRIQHN
jgi:bifunctional ADP-heptose synthase (sugar kinase/adenylyltransferase)